MAKLLKKQKVVKKKKAKAKEPLFPSSIKVSKKKVAKKKVTVKKKVARKKGRPLYGITDKVCLKARKLASRGLTMEQIAAVLGMGKRTLYEKQEKYPHFSQSIKAGRAEGLNVIANSLFKRAKAGGNTAMLFYLKNRDPDNWKEVQKHQLSGVDDKPLVPSSIKIEVVRTDKK